MVLLSWFSCVSISIDPLLPVRLANSTVSEFEFQTRDINFNLGVAFCIGVAITCLVIIFVFAVQKYRDRHRIAPIPQIFAKPSSLVIDNIQRT